MGKKYQITFYFIIPMLILGIYGGYSTFPICVFCLVMRLLMSNKDTIGFYLLMFGGPIAGLIRTCYPFIPIYGVVILFISLLILNKYCIIFFKECKSSIGYMLLVYMVFFISYIGAKSTPYADGKMFDIVYHGSTMLFAFYIYSKSTKISSEHLSQLLLLTTIVYIVGYITIHRFSVGTIFDYDWLRSNFEYYRKLEDDEITGYQKIGMLALLGYTFFISKKELDIKRFIYYSLVTFQVIMTSGARQAMLGFMVVVFIRFAFLNDKSFFKKTCYLILSLCLVFVIYLIVMNVGGAYVQSLEDSGGSGRDLIYLDALRLISMYPLLGVGLGGFQIYSQTADWPHNVFLEIICETGFIGLGILFILVLIFIISKKVLFNITTRNNNYYFLIIVALIVRYMISSDLGDSIELFSVLFAVESLVNFKYLNSKN